MSDFEFVESEYLAAIPDVAAAVAQSNIRSGWEHYQRHGKDEGRRTCEFHLARAKKALFALEKTGSVWESALATIPSLPVNTALTCRCSII